MEFCLLVYLCSYLSGVGWHRCQGMHVEIKRHSPDSVLFFLLVGSMDQTPVSRFGGKYLYLSYLADLGYWLFGYWFQRTWHWTRWMCDLCVHRDSLWLAATADTGFCDDSCWCKHHLEKHNSVVKSLTKMQNSTVWVKPIDWESSSSQDPLKFQHC